MASRIKIAIGVVLFLAFFSSFAQAQKQNAPTHKLWMFYSPACHRCERIKKEILPQIVKEFGDRITVAYFNIQEVENYKLLLGLEKRYTVELANTIPVFCFEGRFLDATSNLRTSLPALLRSSLGQLPKADIPRIDLSERFKSFKPLAIVGAGLIDGINPCAFTVVIFFISFLALQGYRRRELALIGLVFIFAVFFTYILIGLGILGFIYQLQGFWIISRIINTGIGALSIGFGMCALCDFIKFKRTGKTEGLSVQLPQRVKNQIHSIIGTHYRVKKDVSVVPQPRKLMGLIASAFVTGFLVSILEAVCTGQVYLPTITFVLRISTLKIQALGYLLLYNLMFIFPLFVIFFLVLGGVNSGQFSQFFRKHLGLTKILMMCVFFCLGIFLIWRG